MRILSMILAVLPAFALAQEVPVQQGRPNVPEFTPAFPEQTRAPEVATVQPLSAVFASGLERPWGIARLPGGGYLVTERPGRLRFVTPEGVLSDPLANVPAVLAQGQGGLLDVVLAPDFERSRRLYLSYAKPLGNGMSATAAARATLSVDMSALEDVQDIFVQTPPSPTAAHYGSRVVPTPDGHDFRDHRRAFSPG